MSDVVVEVTDDLAAVRRLGVACGLDDSVRDEEVVHVAWGARRDGRLVGAVVLAGLGPLTTVNWLAVAAEERRRGVASRLYAALEQEARRRGVRRLYATARTPGFFFAHGFREVPAGRERDLLLGECPQCEQYGRGCAPRAVVKDLAPGRPGEPASGEE